MARRGGPKTRVERLAHELIRIRWRGLDDLSRKIKGKDPPDTPETDQLAAEYCRVRGLMFGGDRVAEIRLLLQEGLAAYLHQGHQAEGHIFQRLFFEPSMSVPPKRPGDVLEEVKKDKDLVGDHFDYDAWRDSAFPRLAAFLITFVAADQAATEPQPSRALVRVTPISQTSPPPPRPRPRSRLGCAPLALTGFVGLMITCLVVTRLLFGAAASPHLATTGTSAPATVVAGSVECWPDTTKPVVGVWIVASNGGSGWADWHALLGHPNIALFSRTLPHGGSYVVHAGCGGTPRHWGLALDSVTPMLGGGYRFTCYDTTVDRTPYLGLCQP